MNRKFLFQSTIAAMLLAAGAAQADQAETVIQKLPRVVITGRATPIAESQIVQLPRVVVTGMSLNSQLQQQAAVKPAAKPVLRRS